MSISLARKVLLREDKLHVQTLKQSVASLARTGQIARASVEIGNDSVGLGGVIMDAVGTAATVANHSEALVALEPLYAVSDLSQDAGDIAHEASMSALASSMEIREARADFESKLAAVSDLRTSRALKLLWSGGIYMHGTQTVNLAEPISQQFSGIVLAWSAYANGAPADSSWNHVFVPKSHIAIDAGGGVLQNIQGWKTPVWKYIYVYNDRLVGHADNSVAPANTQVLRAVYGV